MRLKLQGCCGPLHSRDTWRRHEIALVDPLSDQELLALKRSAPLECIYSRPHGRRFLRRHAKWLPLDVITGLLQESGFGKVELAETRVERNGPRALLFAVR